MEKKIALVTGAAGGLGLAIAQSLGEAGHEVLLVDRQETVEDRALELRRSGLVATALIADLSNRSAVEQLIADVGKAHGGVDILVNNAGIGLNAAGSTTSFEEMTMTEWDLFHQVNLTAPFQLAHGFFAYMKGRNWGRVINIASRAGRTYMVLASPAYGSAKAGLIGLNRYIAGAGGKYGITSNVIAPGRFDTPAGKTYASPQADAALATIPLARAGRPEEIASIVAFLASDGGAYITGAVLDANGGAFMG